MLKIRYKTISGVEDTVYIDFNDHRGVRELVVEIQTKQNNDMFLNLHKYENSEDIQILSSKLYMLVKGYIADELHIAPIIMTMSRGAAVSEDKVIKLPSDEKALEVIEWFEEEERRVRVRYGAYTHNIPDVNYKPFCVEDINIGSLSLTTLNGKVVIEKDKNIVLFISDIDVECSVLVTDMNNVEDAELDKLIKAVSFFNNKVLIYQEMKNEMGVTTTVTSDDVSGADD